MKDRSRAWRRKQSRRIVNKIEQTKEWLLKPLQKRKADKPSPMPGAKPHAHGKLTKIQQLRLEMYLNSQMNDEAA